MEFGLHAIKRGQTFYGTTGTIPSAAADWGGIHLEGQTKKFRNVKGPNDTTDPNEIGQPRNANSDDFVTCMLVRNNSGVTLLPGRAVTWKSGKLYKHVDGYARTTAVSIAGYVDDHLTSAGVRAGDLFWLVVDGQCLGKTAHTNSEFGGDIAEGDILYAITSAAANATTTNATNTAGRFQRWNGTASSTSTTDGTHTNIILNNFARAITACTTNGTDRYILIDVRTRK